MGYDVVGVDNINDYYDQNIKLSAIAEIEKVAADLGAYFKFYKADITNLESMGIVFGTHKLTHVCHLAAQAGVRHSILHAPENILINITGTINLLELIKEAGDITLTFASSSSVYGQSSTAPFSEDQVCDQYRF